MKVNEEIERNSSDGKSNNDKAKAFVNLMGIKDMNSGDLKES